MERAEKPKICSNLKGSLPPLLPSRPPPPHSGSSQLFLNLVVRSLLGGRRPPPPSPLRCEPLGWPLVPISIRAIPRQCLASRPVDCPVRIAVGPQVSSFPPELASGGQKPQLDFGGEAATAGNFSVLLQESFHLRVQKASSSSPRAVAPGKQGKTTASHSLQKDTTAVHGIRCTCSPT